MTKVRNIWGHSNSLTLDNDTRSKHVGLEKNDDCIRTVFWWSLFYHVTIIQQ